MGLDKLRPKSLQGGAPGGAAAGNKLPFAAILGGLRKVRGGRRQLPRSNSPWHCEGDTLTKPSAKACCARAQASCMFDPYRKWLGIPQECRPPTHYQLLGISPDERDLEVIDAAVLRQSAYVRHFQSGKYGDHATRILNEIAEARICLMDQAKRAAYDAGLNRNPANAAHRTPPAGADTVAGIPNVAPPQPEPAAAASRAVPPPRPRRPGPRRLALPRGVPCRPPWISTPWPARRGSRVAAVRPGSRCLRGKRAASRLITGRFRLAPAPCWP